MDGWMARKKWMVGQMDIYIIDRWLDGYKLIFDHNRRMVGRITKIDGWMDGYKKIYEKLEWLDRQKYNFEKNRCMVGWIGKKMMYGWMDSTYVIIYYI